MVAAWLPAAAPATSPSINSGQAFGSYRTAPSQTYTDRGFTGQKHNDDLGLIYYNARCYLPYSVVKV
ncbi:MAG: hypothetical protein KC418_13620 [Anaerolineales bacterium]|nr:hypothetical protein [Anaerolineales bacterium]MCB8953816.1 hypothetical protein [Ardenticatenales bacterium]